LGLPLLKASIVTKQYQKDFQKTSIHPFNPHAMDEFMTLSEVYRKEKGSTIEEVPKEDQPQEFQKWKIQEFFDKDPHDILHCVHYFVDIDVDGLQSS